MSYRDGSGAVSQYYNTTGRETSHTYTFLNFSTSYTFEVSTRFSKGDLGVPLYVVATTDPFSASVGPLMATVDAQNTLILSCVHVHLPGNNIKTELFEIISIFTENVTQKSRKPRCTEVVHSCRSIFFFDTIGNFFTAGLN